MTDHGLQCRRVHPLQRLGWMQRHYPWSVLWILFMVGVAMAVAGRWVATLIVLMLISVVAIHSIHRDREERRQRRKS